MQTENSLKTSATFSIEIGVMDRMRKICERDLYKMSTIVNRLMKDWMSKQEKESQ